MVEWSELTPRLRKIAEPARRAVLENRDVLLVGPPGAGKTMIARRLRRHPKAVDAMGSETALVYRLAGLLDNRPALWAPFRAPHYTASTLAMTGGGKPVRPGECSLAHGGVLFLDDVAEFRKETLQTVMDIHREKVVEFGQSSPWIRALPADFVLVAATQPCPCGWYGSKVRRCVCSEKIRASYRARIEWLYRDAVVVEISEAINDVRD